MNLSIHQQPFVFVSLSQGVPGGNKVFITQEELFDDSTSFPSGFIS